MPAEPGPPGEIAGQRELLSRLRLAELERRLPVDSSDSGTPSPEERIGTKQARQQSERIGGWKPASTDI